MELNGRAALATEGGGGVHAGRTVNRDGAPHPMDAIRLDGALRFPPK